MAFPSIRRGPLTRFAIHLLLRKAVQVASTRCPSLKNKRVSPHVIRHGTAMALLQAGVDIAVIAVWLGHESIETTSVYIHANLAMKEKALAKIQPMDTPFRRFRADDRLLPSWNRSDSLAFGAQGDAPHFFTVGGRVCKPSRPCQEFRLRCGND
jgi:integrase/recombinase XerD